MRALCSAVAAEGRRLGRLGSKLPAIFAVAVLSVRASSAGDAERPGAGGPGGARAARAPEELLPPGAMGLVSVRNVSRTLERLRGLGLWRIAEALELPRRFERALRSGREQLGAVLAATGVTLEDVERLFAGGAFAALYDLQGEPPQIPQALVWIEAKRPEARAIESFTAFLAGLAGAQGLAVETYDYMGAKVSTVGLPLPGMPLDVAWAFAGEGFAFSIGRAPLEEFISRAAAPRGEKPKRECLADIPACKELRSRLGGGEDLLVLWNVQAVLARLGGAIAPRERQILAATGLDRATAGYGLAVHPRAEGPQPGGVKEAFVVCAPPGAGVLSLLAQGELARDRLAEALGQERPLLAVEAMLDLQPSFDKARELLRSVEGEQAARELARGLSDAAAAVGMEQTELLRTLSGRLSLRVSPREAGFVPDATLVFESRSPDGLRKLLGRLEQVVEEADVQRVESGGLSIAAILPRDRDVPAVVTPAFCVDGEALCAALSVQGMKRLIRERSRAALLAELDEPEPGAGPVRSALRELSPGAWVSVTLDAARAGGVAFDIASFVPGWFGRRFREFTLRMPPVEDLLGELGEMAVAVYGKEGLMAVETWSPTGFVPLATGVAVMAARERRPAAPPRPQRPPAREEDLF